MLDLQIREVIVKARMIQKSLFCLLAAVFVFLLCSLFAGATLFNDWFGVIALGTGVFGILLFLFGLGLAMRKLTLSLTPLEEESVYLEVVKAHRIAMRNGGKRLKIAEIA